MNFTQFSEYLTEQRPKLSTASKKTYYSLLSNLNFRLYGKKVVDLEKFAQNVDEVIDFVNQSQKINYKKTIYSALFILTNIDAYNLQMRQGLKEYNEKTKSRTKNVKEERNWLDFAEIQEMHDRHLSKIEKLMKLKQLNSNELQQIQNFLIFCVSSGVYLAPRRNADYIHMKIHSNQIDLEKDNYIVFSKKKNQFVFNIYKTAKTYETQVIDIPVKLVKLLKAWIKIIPSNSEYLFFSNKNTKLSTSQYTQRLNKFTGKNISSSMLRKIYISDKYKDIPDIMDRIEEISESMGHSSDMALSGIYLKK